MTIFSTGGEEEHSERCTKQRGSARCESKKVGTLNGVTNTMNLPVCISCLEFGSRTGNEIPEGTFWNRLQSRS